MTTPVGPYAPAVRAGPWLVCSGQIGLARASGGPAIVEGGLESEARQALENLAAVLAGHGMGWESVVKTTVFLVDMNHYAAFNAVYVDVLGDQRPARSVVAVAALPLGAQVEIEAWAYRPPA